MNQQSFIMEEEQSDMSLFEPFIVAAIDIGTTSSTYAFSTRDDFRNDPPKIYAKANWVASDIFLGEKTATVVLFDENKNFRYFGFEAEDAYADLDDDKKKNWYFFSRFKMNLFQRKKYRENMQLKDIQGKKMPAIDVFSAAIAYLKDHLLQMARDRLPDIKERDFLWVITVPAIWEDGARQFMRKAAIKAHFWENCGNGDPGKQFNDDSFKQDDKKQEAISKQIWLALEPETAALYCKLCQLQLIRSKTGVASTVPFIPKQKFLLMDLGGGTADIIAYEVLESHDLRELTEPNGGDWGGVTVDEAFWCLLKTICGDEAIDKFSTEEMGDFLNMQKQFERKKRSISKSSKEATLTRIQLCPKLADIYKERRGVKPEQDTIPLEDGIGYKMGKLELSNTVSLSLFEKPEKNIVDFLKDKYFLKGNIYDLDTIVMVGGFSASNIMKQAVKSAVTGMGIRVIIPDEPILAVVKGAVLYGHNRMAIRERVLPYTYGISLRVTFDETSHPIDKRIWCSNRQTYVVEDVFQPFMRAGTRVIPGETFANHTYRALYYSTNKATIEIYRTRDPNPRFVTDQGCSGVGKLELEIPTLKDFGSKLIDIKMSFGDTELTVEAKDNDSDNRIKAEFNFLI